jgi:hypothetical protein
MKPEKKSTTASAAEPGTASKPKATPDGADPQKEVGGQKGPEPTRYGDWEKNGIISDF